MNKLEKILEDRITAAIDGMLGSVPNSTEPTPVVVCTDKRAVVFGYTTNPKADPIKLTDARMCLYWSKAVGGVFGLSDVGPDRDCKISATTPSVELPGVTAVFTMTPDAVEAWKSAATQGRE